MKNALLAILLFAAALPSYSLTVEEAKANLSAARKAYKTALAEAGITSTPRRISRGVASSSVLTKSQKSFFENRRIAVSRDTATIPGSVITTWYRNGKPDTKAPAVVTNVLRTIVGREQSNPLQVLAERYRLAVVEATNRLAMVTADYMSASNRAARAEARTAAIIAWAEEQRDKAVLPTTKAIWQEFIDRLKQENS